MSENKKFGLLCYSDTDNLGDEMQSVAARRLLPKVDFLINREELDRFFLPTGELASIILNGWFCHSPEHWPPSESLNPLLISFHISDFVNPWSGISAREAILSKSGVKYLNQFGPVGARDLHTLELLRSAGVDSYFSGCLTLTLQRPEVSSDSSLIVLNDVPDDVYKAVTQRSKKEIRRTSHSGFAERDYLVRSNEAVRLLELYARASFVITTRLHCALPCLAIGTPVLLLQTAPDWHRFAGLKDLVSYCSVRDFVNDKEQYNVDNPRPNSRGHEALRESIIFNVGKFLGSNPIKSPPSISIYDRYRDMCEVHKNTKVRFRQWVQGNKK